MSDDPPDPPPAASGRLDLRAVGERQVVMTRSFAAPPSLVFAALTDAALLLRWLHGPPGWRMVDCEMDPVEGGRYRYVWHGPDGQTMTAEGTIRQIDPPKRLVTVERFDDDWTAGEVTSVFELAAHGAGTVLINTATYASRAARDAALASGMEHGMEASYAHLDRLLAGQV